MRYALPLVTVLALAACKERDPVATVRSDDAGPAAAPEPATTEDQAQAEAANSAASACQKMEDLWTNQLLPSAYQELPALTAPGPFELAQMAQASFMAKTFSHGTDLIEPGRRKLVHAFGSVAKLAFVPGAGAATSGFTGFYGTGAPCLIGRFSVASKPSVTNMIPALALKFFVDGAHDSLNIHVMNSTAGQNKTATTTGHNFFQEVFSNILPEPTDTASKLIAGLFRRGAELFGAKDPTANTLSVEHLATMAADGAAVQNPVAPLKVSFVPLPTATGFMRNATINNDFRVGLAQIPAGTELFEIFAGNDANGLGTSLGKLVLKSPIVATGFGDRKLWFQHNKAH